MFMDLFRLPISLNDSLMERHDQNHVIFDDNAELKAKAYAVASETGTAGFQKRLVPDIPSPSLGLYGLFLTMSYLQDLGVDVLDFYKTNSMGFRCDEFQQAHEKTHILFAGCSITFGEAVPPDYVWAKKLYDKIALEYDVSGYYNVGTPGTSISKVVQTIKAYIDNFGEPDYIFCLLPDTARDGGVGVQHFVELENTANSKFFTATWDRSFTIEQAKGDDSRNKIQSIHQISAHESTKAVYNFEQSYKGLYKNFCIRGTDDSHPGIGEHDFYFNFFYDLYQEYRNSV